MSGVTEVRLYRNTVDEVPTEYTNVTAAVLNSSTKNHVTGVKRYLDGVATVDGLEGGTHYFWVELIDAAGNTAGPQPVGDVHIRHDLDAKLVEHGNNIVAELDGVKFNGSNSYARFADMNEQGVVDYGDFVRSGTWSMTFWIKPLVDPSDERRFLVLRKEDLGILYLSNKRLYSWVFNEPETNLANNTWHFFALSVDDHNWTIHKSINGSDLVTTSLGVWNISSMESNRMFIGANNGWGTQPYSEPFWWDGYARKVTIDNRPLTGEEVTTIYNATQPPTVWEFYIASLPSLGILVYSIDGSFGVTNDNLSMSSDWGHNENPDTPIEVYATNGVTERLHLLNQSVGQYLWTIVDTSMTESPVFTVLWRNEVQTPGIEIRKNGVTVTHVESSREIAYMKLEKTYEIPTPTVWEFYVSAMTDYFKPHLFAIESSFGVTPENLVMASGWVQDIPGSPDLGAEVSVTNGVQWTDRLANRDVSNGSKLWTITDETGSESPVFTVTWRKPLHTPGVEIRKNGVVVYSETENGGSVETPEENVVTYSL